MALPIMGEMSVRTERVCMAVSATACRLVLQLHAEHIEQEENEDACASPLEPACHIVTAGVSAHQMVGEPLAGQQLVNRHTEEDGTCDDGGEIEQERLLSQHFVDDQDACHIAGRTSHEHHQGGSGCQALHHECHRDRDAARGTDIHRHTDAQHQEHTQGGVVLEDGEELIGHQGGNQSRHDKTHNQPLTDVLHHFDKAELEGRDDPLTYSPRPSPHPPYREGVVTLFVSFRITSLIGRDTTPSL